MDCRDSPSFVIASQDDINNSTFAQYSCFLEIAVYNATGSLNFTDVVSIYNFSVSDSPELESLIFPTLVYASSFSVDNAWSLVNISMPLLTISDGVPSINLTDASLLQTLDYGNVTQFAYFTLNGLNVITMSNITEVSYLDTGPNVFFPNLTSAEEVKMSFTDPIVYKELINYPELTNVADYMLEYGHNLDPYHQYSISIDMFKGSLSIRSLEYDENKLADPNYSPSGFINSLYFSTTSIGRNAGIHSNTNVYISLDALATVGSNFSFVNNTNCSLNVNQLSRVGDLVMTDNPNTTLPFLPNLKTANNIHFRGYIDTTAGVNIFPALSLVSGSVTIEAWNSDFNCSKLVAQYRDSVIHNLSCNGTDNSTVPTLSTLPTASAKPTNPSHGLSDGARAGVGVSIGAIVLGSIIALAWLFLHYHRRQQQDKSVNRESSGPQEKEDEVYPPGLGGLRKAQGSRIIREAPDGAVHEMLVQPAEKPDDHLREMMALPGEFPASLSAYDEIGDREGDIMNSRER